MVKDKRRRGGSKKPLPFEATLPQAVPVTDLTPEIQTALFTLIAHCVNHGAEVMNFNVPDARAGTLELGPWKITVAQVG